MESERRALAAPHKNLIQTFSSGNSLGAFEAGFFRIMPVHFLISECQEFAVEIERRKALICMRSILTLKERYLTTLAPVETRKWVMDSRWTQVIHS